ncbi:MAG: hypothetical protein ACLU38_04450 [Dysosmobacter sp.]
MNCSVPCLLPVPGRPRLENLPAAPFLNGKMDLTEAEAVIDLIDAQSAAAAKTPQPSWTAVSAAAWSRCRRPSSTSPPGFTPW